MKTKEVANNLFPQSIVIVYGSPEEFHKAATGACGEEIEITVDRLNRIDACFFERAHVSGQYTLSFIFVHDSMKEIHFDNLLILSHESLHCAIAIMNHFCSGGLENPFTIETQTEEEIFVRLHEFYTSEVVMFLKECLEFRDTKSEEKGK